MSVELTEQQQFPLDTESGKPARVADPRGNVAHYLVPEAEYADVREIPPRASLFTTDRVDILPAPLYYTKYH